MPSPCNIKGPFVGSIIQLSVVLFAHDSRHLSIFVLPSGIGYPQSIVLILGLEHRFHQLNFATYE